MTQTTDYILKDIKPIQVVEKIENVQALFEQYPFSHLPIVDKNIFCGNIAKQDVEFTDLMSLILFFTIILIIIIL